MYFSGKIGNDGRGADWRRTHVTGLESSFVITCRCTDATGPNPSIHHPTLLMTPLSRWMVRPRRATSPLKEFASRNLWSGVNEFLLRVDEVILNRGWANFKPLPNFIYYQQEVPSSIRMHGKKVLRAIL